MTASAGVAEVTHSVRLACYPGPEKLTLGMGKGDGEGTASLSGIVFRVSVVFCYVGWFPELVGRMSPPSRAWGQLQSEGHE